MSQLPNISHILSDKPKIGPVEESPLLARLKSFLPQMEEANRSLASSSSNDLKPEDEYVIERVEESSDSDSDSEDDSDSEKDVEKVPEKDRIEIDVDVFREKNSKVDNRDVSVQQVEELPKAFIDESEERQVEVKKTLIEEL